MKYVAMILVALMCLSVFAACGSDDNDTQTDDNDTQTNDNDTQSNDNDTQSNDNDTKTNDNDTQSNDNDTQTNDNDTQSNDNGSKNESKEPTYTPYNVGDITVDIPDGWKAFSNTDIHADDPTTISKRSVNVCKGGVTEIDVFTKPYVKIDYCGSDIYMMAPDKSFYENVVDVAPVELGGRTWSGFSCESLGYPIIILTAENGDDQFQVNIFRGQDDDAISLEDEEVRRIIASITVNETADSSESSEGSSADTSAE